MTTKSEYVTTVCKLIYLYFIYIGSLNLNPYKTLFIKTRKIELAILLLIGLLISNLLISVKKAYAEGVCPTAASRVYLQTGNNDLTVYICTDENNTRRPKYWVGVSHTGLGNINLPLSSYGNGVYTARNGKYKYILEDHSGRLTVVFPNGRRVTQEVYNADE